ncbi:hypothetical protein MNBD_GAMMA23-1591 [hydrothermal vent metagenome]|uniref:Death on curing protein, Doc toxin n=1 Tax=hydrothermal vent metagenome TaxID=652676 RepID=A0A3B1AG71_9ZZZZ
MNVSYSPESIGDLIRVREFIEIKNSYAAEKMAASISKGIAQLKAFPYLGVEVELAPKPEVLRDLIIGNYIVRYLIHAEQIYILRVWHHKEERL